MGGGGAFAKPDQDCYDSFEAHCGCEEDYMLTKNGCLFCNRQDPDKWCIGELGEGAFAKDEDCYTDSAEHCDCEEDYMMTKNACIFCNPDPDKWCIDELGEGAFAKDGVDCHTDSGEHCDCEEDYMMTKNGCILCNSDPDQWCVDELGVGAFAKDGVDCYTDSGDHCDCEEDYTMTKKGCQKLCNVADPDGWCRDALGVGASARDGVDCYDSPRDHCRCSNGYVLTGNGCEDTCNRANPESFCRSIGGEGAFAREDVNCWVDFSAACSCFEGYQQTATGCDGPSRAAFIGNQLRHVANDGLPTTAYPLKNCQGDCDSDTDCEGSLVCSQRSSGNIAVPGCTGGEDEAANYDYCYDPLTPLPTEEPVTTLPLTNLPSPHNTTYTMYDFVIGKVVEAGCSFTETSVVAACMGGKISQVGISHPSIVCGESGEYEDGSSRLNCNKTCVGDACQGVLLVTTPEFGDLHFLCESSDSSNNQTFACGVSGIMATSISNETTRTSLYNVGRDKEFSWGLFGPDLCLNNGPSSSSSTAVTARNPDIEP